MRVPDDADPVLASRARAHAYAREQGFSGPLYAAIRALATAVLPNVVSRTVSGAEHIPADGGVIVAPNHKNFLDPFFIGIATRRHVRFMAKIELFKGPLRWLLVRLGAFPIRRGESDTEALDTAAAILRAGGLVVVFPEGTRVEQPDALGAPRHGAGAWRSRPECRSSRRRSPARLTCGAVDSRSSGECRSPSSPRSSRRRRPPVMILPRS